MNDITKEFKKAVEDRYAEDKAHYKKHTQFACSTDLYGVRDRAKTDIMREWAKAGRDMSDVDFDVELDVDLNLN